MPAHQFSLQLIRHEVNNSVIPQRSTDGYINATELCKVAGKQWGHYAENARTKEFLGALAADIGIPISELIQVVKGGNGPQGTWVHPQVAINLAQWLSADFAVKVSKWVFDWMSGKGSPVMQPGQVPYHIRRHMLNFNSVPAGHFSVLQEMTFILIGPLDQYGYEMPERLVPDISMGLFLCKHLREKLGVDTDNLPLYLHRYPDGRVVSAKAYPDELLAEFRRIIREEWLPHRAANYFKDRDPAVLPYLDKVILSLPKPAPSPSPLPPSGRRGSKKKAA